MDVDYNRSTIEPLYSTADVTFLGELDEVRKPDFYASAAGTLFPSDWPEPFGLVMIESMAAGTPAIALRRGAVPEIVRHGVTGFIRDTVDEMVVALGRLGDIDPEACKRQAKDFDAGRMSRAYERLYKNISTGARNRTAVDSSLARVHCAV